MKTAEAKSALEESGFAVVIPEGENVLRATKARVTLTLDIVDWEVDGGVIGNMVRHAAHPIGS